MLTAKPREIFPSRRGDSIRGRSERELHEHGVESCGNGRHRHPSVREGIRGVEGDIKTIKNHPGGQFGFPQRPFVGKWPVSARRASTRPTGVVGTGQRCPT
jgi:hypothetical protein